MTARDKVLARWPDIRVWRGYTAGKLTGVEIRSEQNPGAGILLGVGANDEEALTAAAQHPSVLAKFPDNVPICGYCGAALTENAFACPKCDAKFTAPSVAKHFASSESAKETFAVRQPVPELTKDDLDSIGLAIAAKEHAAERDGYQGQADDWRRILRQFGKFIERVYGRKVGFQEEDDALARVEPVRDAAQPVSAGEKL